MRKRLITVLLVMLLLSSFAVPALASVVELKDGIIISPMGKTDDLSIL